MNMLSARLGELRERQGIKQKELSKRLHMSQQTYSAYETGKRQMNHETLCLIADYYEVSTDYLLGRQDKLPSFLDDEERNIIDQYRGLDDRGKESVKASLAFECAHAPKPDSIKKSAM